MRSDARKRLQAQAPPGSECLTPTEVDVELDRLRGDLEAARKPVPSMAEQVKPSAEDDIRLHVTGFAAGKADGQQTIVALHALIAREREMARAEGAAAVAGPVLVLADRVDALAKSLTLCTGSNCAGCQLRAAVTRFRTAIPSDATEALERVRAEAKAEALREAADDLYGDERATGPNAHPLSVGNWIRGRADQIEAEAVRTTGEPVDLLAVLGRAVETARDADDRRTT